jgi:hypothetical protein
MLPATSEAEKVRFHTLNRATGNRVHARHHDWTGAAAGIYSRAFDLGRYRRWFSWDCFLSAPCRTLRQVYARFPGGKLCGDVSHSRADQKSGRNQAAFPIEIDGDGGHMVSATAARHGEALAVPVRSYRSRWRGPKQRSPAC